MIDNQVSLKTALNYNFFDPILAQEQQEKPL